MASGEANNGAFVSVRRNETAPATTPIINGDLDGNTSLKRLCRVCCQGEEKSRKLCHFAATETIPDDVYLHVFCGKTAAILPHVNRPDLEILTKAGIKNKHGTGVSVTMALQRCRSAKVDDASGREQEYFLSKEFERIYFAIAAEPTVVTPEEPVVTDPHHDFSFQEIDTDANTGPLARGTVPSSGNLTEDKAVHQDQTSSVTPDQQTSVDHQTGFQPVESQSPPQCAAESKLTRATHLCEPQSEPPNKKQRQENVATTKSPYDVEMERLQMVCDRCNGVGYSLVRGVARLEDDADDDEDFDPTDCSQEQVDHVRVIVITKNRQEIMEQMGHLVLGKQYGEQLLQFDTSFSYDVLKAWNEFTFRFHAASNNKEKFDLLLGFTHTIKEHDVWMHDHEPGWGGDDMVRQLGLSWSLVLSRPDPDLGIDSDFTRPGVIALLEQFKEAVESADMQFDFAPS